MGNFDQRGMIRPEDNAHIERLSHLTYKAQPSGPQVSVRPFTSVRSAFEIVSIPLPVASDDCINISALSLPYLLSTLDAFASLGHFACYWAGSNRFVKLTSTDTAAAGRLARNGRIEIFVIDAQARLIDVFSVRFWMPRADFYHTPDTRSPIRHLPLDLNVAPPLPTEYDIDFPIDAVITWVDGSDPNWQRMVAQHLEGSEIDYDRYTSNDELRFAIRSIEMFAPWVRTIHVLSNCRPPSWFKSSKRVKWVDHADCGDPSILPLFSSHSIELLMSGITALSEHFIYFNDDTMLGKPCRPSDFFLRNGASIARLESYGRALEFRGAKGLPEWQMAAANGAKLIHERFGYYPTRLHQHVPFALRKSVLAEMETAFPEEVGRTRLRRFRSSDDISPVSFLYHHFAIASGKAIALTATSFIVRSNNFRDFKMKFEKGTTFDFLCVNDGEGSHADENYTKFKHEFLPKMAPFAASCESSSNAVRDINIQKILGVDQPEPPPRPIKELSPWRRPLHRALAIAVAPYQPAEDRVRFRKNPVEYLSKAKVRGNRVLGKILLRSDQRPY